MTDVIDEEPAGRKFAGAGTGSNAGEQSFGEVEIGDADKVVSARGTEDGLILRIDGGAPWEAVLNELDAFLGGRRRFFEGGEVSIEWLERLPGREQCGELEQILKSEYGLTVVTRRRRMQRVKPAAPPSQQSGGASAVPLFEEQENRAVQEEISLVEKIEQMAAGRDDESFTVDSETAGSEPGRRRLSQLRKTLGDDLFYEDDANAKVVFGTLRSGQRVETPFSLVVIGDVNPGADLVAGGDIIVVGSLRGTAHASAYDDDAFDSVIIAMHMQPMQLRIGSIISRGSDEVVQGVEIARIENRRIVVESFNPRTLIGRKAL